MAKKIKLSKRYQTLSGLPVTLLTIDARHFKPRKYRYPARGLIHTPGGDQSPIWTADGAYYEHNGPYTLDLVKCKRRAKK